MQNNVRLPKNKSLRIYTLRKTFFDIIEENIQFPRLLIRAVNGWFNEFFGSDSYNLYGSETSNPPGLSAVSVANGKIITTSQSTDFTLFSLEDNEWTESVVEFPWDFIPSAFNEQLLTVRNLDCKR